MGKRGMISVLRKILKTLNNDQDFNKNNITQKIYEALEKEQLLLYLELNSRHLYQEIGDACNSWRKSEFSLDFAFQDNKKDKDNIGLIHIVAESGYYHVAKTLLEGGANIDIKAGGKYDWAPLHFAVSVGNGEVAEMLINGGADINARSEKKGNTPLHVAVFRGHINVVQLLIKRGADINAQNAFGDVALNFAVYYRHIEMTNMLIDNGASVHARNKGEFTPLHLAVEVGFKEGVILLIEKKANVNVQNIKGNISLHIAIEKYNMEIIRMEIIRLLIENGANFNIKNKKENTCLDFAAIKGILIEVEHLIKNYINAQNSTNNPSSTLQLSRGLKRQSEYSEGGERKVQKLM